MRPRAAKVAAVATSIMSTVAVAAILAAARVWTPRLPTLAAARQWIHQPLTTAFVVALAEGGAVMLWLLLATAVLTRAYASVTRRLRWPPALHLPGTVQGLTAALLGATAVTTATAGTPAHAAAATDATHEGAQPAAEASTTALLNRHVNRSQEVTLVAAGRTYTHTVERGDTLSKIAAQWLGDADRWPEIFALNRGTHFTHARGTLRNPNIIYPGWTLTLPDDAAPPATHYPRRPVPAPRAPDEPGRATPAPAPTTETTPPTATAPTAEPSHTRTPTDGSCATSDSRPDTAASGSTSDEGARSERRPDGVSLRSGSWIDLGLALAITAAVALLWAHRRRRAFTASGGGEAASAPLSRVVNQIRAALPRFAALQPATGEHDEHSVAASVIGDVDDLDSGADLRRRGQHESNDRAAVAHSVDAGQGDGGLRPVVPGLAHQLPVVWPHAGMGLTGPGAPAAARGFLTAALAADSDEHLRAGTQVVMPSAMAATLLGGTADTLPRTPRLTLTRDLDEALNILEALALHRTRLVDHHEVSTVADVAANVVEESLPPVMLLTHVPERPHRARLTALLTQGQRLDIHAVLLGPWPDGDTVAIDKDGTTTPADSDTDRHGAHPADLGRVAVLDPTETLDLLATLAKAHTLESPTPPQNETGPADRQDIGTAHPDSPAPLTGDERQDPARANDPAAHLSDHQMQAFETTAADASPHIAARLPATSPTPPAVEPAAAMLTTVEVTVLGTPRIVDVDPKRPLRAKSLELLVYLAVRDGSATVEAILDDLLPDAPARKANERLHTYVSNLRSVLRHRGGPGDYVTHPHVRYELDPDRLDVDLWRMRAATRAANTATTKAERVAALRRAVDAYRAPLADASGYEWIEPYREAVRQQALDAAVALTEELEGQPPEQLAVLEAAIGHHPYAEQLYQAAMRARAHLGDLEGVRALRRTLTLQLAEIDAEPSEETLTLVDTLITQLEGT